MNVEIITSSLIYTSKRSVEVNSALLVAQWDRCFYIINFSLLLQIPNFSEKFIRKIWH